MPGFFTKAPVADHAKQTSGLNFINVGGEPFHATAVALVDSLKTASRIHEPLLKKVLESFFFYYPKFKAQQAYLTPTERMSMLLSNPRKSEIVECMAYVLRQLAVDEVYTHPLDLNYREIFDGLDENTLKNVLRQSTTVLPSAALHALARSLDVTIILSHVEHDKELRRRQVFTHNTESKPKMQLNLQVQGGYFFPRVQDKADFAYVGQLAISAPAPKEDGHDATETMADLMHLVKKDNNRLLHTYQQWRQNFLTMVDGGEVTTSSMRDAYIAFVSTPDGNLTNWQNFLTKLSGSGLLPVAADSTRGIAHSLASVLAVMISIGWVKADELFDRMEVKASHTASPAA